MKIVLAAATCQPDLLYETVTIAADHAEGDVGLVVVGNGCDVDAKKFPEKFSFATVRNREKNEGVPRALHDLWELSCSAGSPEGRDEVVCYIHDDLQILEKGWDSRIRETFTRDPRCGLAGFGGSTALGGDEIYKVPYEVHQLGRRDFWSNMVGAEVHGKQTTTPRPIVFTDGQSMFVRRSLLDEIQGWSWWPFHLVHHAYDYGIACMARRRGYTGWLVPCHVNHLGGQTMPVYHALADQHGGDSAVHAASHRFVYEEFRDVLPLRLK